MRYCVATVGAFLLALALAGHAHTQETTITLTIQGGDADVKNVPICVPLSLPKDYSRADQAWLEGADVRMAGQLTAPSLLTANSKPGADSQVRRDLHFVLPQLKAGTTLRLRCTVKPYPWLKNDNIGFRWTADERDFSELALQPVESGAQPVPVLRYLRAPYDSSSKAARDKTYKVFHHLYDPAGKRFVTNGGHTDPHTDPKKLLFPHHRGLGYGFNRITYDKNKKADTWHCQGDDYQEHVKTLSMEAGPVLGRHRVLINWHGSEKDVFAKEEREVTVYRVPGGTLVEWASLLKTTGGAVRLDGDPQHAGFQFRAHNDVAAKTAKQTYYLRVDGKGKPGQTINWSAKDPPKGTVDVPWKAMSFVLDGKRYTVAYLDHPLNPGEARHSERDYGRFGYYFEYNLTKDNPLLVRYRIWLQDGEMTPEQVAELHRAFVSPPAVTVK